MFKQEKKESWFSFFVGLMAVVRGFIIVSCKIMSSRKPIIEKRKKEEEQKKRKGDNQFAN
jgi:hypothetical protein